MLLVSVSAWAGLALLLWLLLTLAYLYYLFLVPALQTNFVTHSLCFHSSTACAVCLLYWFTFARVKLVVPYRRLLWFVYTLALLLVCFTCLAN